MQMHRLILASMHCDQFALVLCRLPTTGDFTVTSPGLSKNALAVGATQVGMQAAAWLGAPVTCWVVFCCKGQAADCNERAEL